MKYFSDSVERTYEIAKNLAETLSGGEIILLYGELGAGKTTFTKGLAKALGIEKTVKSPTFTILKSYQGRLTLNHFDMYRLKEKSDAQELGFEEVIGDINSVTVIEWNKFASFDGKVIIVDIKYASENGREIEIAGT